MCLKNQSTRVFYSEKTKKKSGCSHQEAGGQNEFLISKADNDGEKRNQNKINNKIKTS